MKKILSVVLAIFLVHSVFLLEVDQTEVMAGDGTSIEFINYTGPVQTFNSDAEIRGIGSSLAESLKSTNMNNQSIHGSQQRYQFIHAVDPSTNTKFDADILILGTQSNVDHIDNIRRILSAYLSTAYGYSTKEASTLATYITVYNAVYRGKMDIFNSKYKPVVLGYLSQESVGLSVNYKDWPGKTQIVIPLSEARLSGTVSSISTTVLTEKDVIEKIQEDSSEGIALRKDMVELKETEQVAAEQRAQQAQQEAVQAKEEQKAKTAEASTATKEAAQAQKEAEQAQKEAAAKPEDTKAQEVAKEKQAEADQKAEIAAQKQEEAKKAQEKVTKKETVSAKDQVLADTKQKETIQERKEIAKDIQKQEDDEKARLKAEQEAALKTSLPTAVLRVVDETDYLSDIIVLDLATGKELTSSTLSSIRNRTLLDTGTDLMAIAGKKAANSAVRLVLFDDQSLEVILQGEDNIAEASMLVKNQHDYYAVIEQASNRYVLGRFDAKLQNKAKSAIEVKPYTTITVTEKGILVQNTQGAVKLLRATDLVELK